MKLTALKLIIIIGHLALSVRTQNFSTHNTNTTLQQWQPPPPPPTTTVNGHAISLPSGGYILLLTNYNNSTPVAASVQADELFPNRIVGGRRISIREAPWQIILRKDGFSICGGSIINRLWILTAAHCVVGGGRFSIRAGSSYYRRNGEVRRVRKVFYPRNYNGATFRNDIALLKLRTPLRYNARVRNVRLARPGTALPRKYSVSGWGVTMEGSPNLSRVLRRVQVRNVNNNVCRRLYAGRVRITANMICAAAPNKDSCSGDSGGPLAHNGRQFGIVSFGIGCARRSSPGVYTDVRKYRSFIRAVLRRN